MIINKTTKEQRSRPWSVSAGSLICHHLCSDPPPLLNVPLRLYSRFQSGRDKHFLRGSFRSLGMASPASTCQLAWPPSPSLGVCMIAHYCYHHSLTQSMAPMLHAMLYPRPRAPNVRAPLAVTLSSIKNLERSPAPNHVAERCKAIFSLVRCCCRADWERERKKKQENKTE